MNAPSRVDADPAWQALAAHHAKVKDAQLRHPVLRRPGTVRALLGRRRRPLPRLLEEPHHRRKPCACCWRWPTQRGVLARRDAMFRGEKINNTEKRAVLHVALRAPQGTHIEVDGKDVVPEVHAVLDRMASLPTAVRSGNWKGYTGKRIRNVINIGIGGSYLGPEMAYRALRPFSDPAMTFRFVANVDGAALTEATADLDAAETLFIISSKTFTTLETMTNAAAARKWTVDKLGSRCRRRPPLRCRLNQRQGREGIRHRRAEHVRLLGLGRRPLFDGQRHRTFHHDRRRSRQFPRHARRVPRHGRAFPHHAARTQPPAADGPADRLVQRFLRRPDPRHHALRRTTQPLPRLPPAVADGKQRQARRSARQQGRLRNRADHLGRAWHRRAALLLPVDSSGHEAHPLRSDRLPPAAQPADAPARPAHGQPVRPGRGAGLRQDARRTWRPRACPTGKFPTACSKATARPT